MYSTYFVLFATLCWVQLARAAFRNLIDEPIRYPGPTQEVTQNRYSQINEYNEDEDVPDECKDQMFCTIKPAGYNQKKYDSLFHGLKFVPQPSRDAQNDDLGSDRQGDPGEKDDCETTVTYQPLYRVKSHKGEWRTVIQSPAKNFVQRVRLETCKNPGESCFKVFPSLPNLITSCKQKYNVWELMVEGENGPETIKTDLPICCSCTYKKIKPGRR